MTVNICGLAVKSTVQGFFFSGFESYETENNNKILVAGFTRVLVVLYCNLIILYCTLVAAVTKLRTGTA